MCDKIQLADFNDLFVLAVGLSMAYVIIEGKRQSSFYHILAKITDTIKEQALRIRTKPLRQEEALIARIDYYLSSGLLRDETRGALNLISQKANEVVEDVHRVEEWSERKLRFHTKTDFLPVISYDCFLFGIFVLVVGVLQEKCSMCIDGLVQIMLMALLALLVHCLWFERLEMDKRWKRFLGPGFVWHSVILIVALFVGIKWMETVLFPVGSGMLSACCAGACFIGFIAYLALNILANFILFIRIMVKIFSLKIQANAKTHETDLGRYQEELDKIDQKLREENLSKFMDVTADSICTEADDMAAEGGN